MTMKFDATELYKVAASDKDLARLRRTVRNQFKKDTAGDATYRIRLMLVKDGYQLRIKITVQREHEGTSITHVLSLWAGSNHLVAVNVWESFQVSPAHNGKAVTFDFDPEMQSMRTHGIKALYTLGGDPLLQLMHESRSRSKVVN